MHIVEIGGGYGGLCRILAQLGGFASYTIIDIPQANALAKKYLSLYNIPNVFFIDRHQLDHLPTYDLVISSYSFAESDGKEQVAFIERIIDTTPNGYMTFNSKAQKAGFKSVSIDQLIRILYLLQRRGKLEKEQPAMNSNDMLVYWSNKLPPPLHPHFQPPQLAVSLDYQTNNAITYSLSGGRMGDNLLSYLHAKWIAYKYQMPLLNIPFPFANYFNFHHSEQHVNHDFLFKNYCVVRNMNMFHPTPSSSLFEIPYFPESKFDYDTAHLQDLLPYFKVDWDDSTFKNEIIQALTPKQPIQIIDLPQDRITIGVHVRRGGGVDHPASCFSWPLKFPPDSYYIQQIQRLTKIFKNQPLFIYIFTDDLNPSAITEYYQKALNNPYLEFQCRRVNNSPHLNILEDFFSIPTFDCMILCQSSFSLAASKLGHYAIAITPLHAIIRGNEIIIDEIEVAFDGLKMD
jgi:hypothetical protein